MSDSRDFLGYLPRTAFIESSTPQKAKFARGLGQVRGCRGVDRGTPPGSPAHSVPLSLPVSGVVGEQRSPYSRKRIYAPHPKRDTGVTLVVLGERCSCVGRQRPVIRGRRAARYEVIVENSSQLGFGQVRGRGESRVQVFQTRRDQRHVEHTRLRKSQVDAQVGNVEPVVGFDEFSAVGGATSTCREFDAQPGQGRIGGVGKKPNEKQRPIPRRRS